MLWIKSLHIIFMVTWFAGLFYLPRLFVYHAQTEAQTENAASKQRFKTMEHRLFWAIMTPGGILTAIFGLWMLAPAWEIYLAQQWMQQKLALVALLVVYHIWCGKLMRDFSDERNRHSETWYRYFNEVPTVGLAVIVILAVVKP